MGKTCCSHGEKIRKNRKGRWEKRDVAQNYKIQGDEDFKIDSFPITLKFHYNM